MKTTKKEISNLLITLIVAALAGTSVANLAIFYFNNVNHGTILHYLFIFLLWVTVVYLSKIQIENVRCDNYDPLITIFIAAAGIVAFGAYISEKLLS